MIQKAPTSTVGRTHTIRQGPSVVFNVFLCVIVTVTFSSSSPSVLFSFPSGSWSSFSFTMQPNIYIYLYLGGVLRYARAYSDLAHEAYDGDLIFGDELIDPMQSDEVFNPKIDLYVDPMMGLDDAINVDQNPILLADINEYCSPSAESPELLIGKIRVRGESCNSLKSTPPSPKVNLPSLQLPKKPELQTPSLGNFPILPPFIRNPRCYNKSPYCCPFGRMPDNTFPGCKVCEGTSSSSYILKSFNQHG